MKKGLNLFLKGIVLGIAFIIPGVSGGTLAVLLGIYEELLDKVSNFYKSKKNFIDTVKYMLPLGIGVLAKRNYIYGNWYCTCSSNGTYGQKWHNSNIS